MRQERVDSRVMTESARREIRDIKDEKQRKEMVVQHGGRQEGEESIAYGVKSFAHRSVPAHPGLSAQMPLKLVGRVETNIVQTFYLSAPGCRSPDVSRSTRPTNLSFTCRQADSVT